MESGLPGNSHRLSRLGGGVQPTERIENGRVERLRPEGDTREACTDEPLGQVLVPVLRIGFERDLGIVRQAESIAETVDDPGHRSDTQT